MDMKFRRSPAAVLVIIALLLSACQPAITSLVPAASATLIPTDSPIPPTATPTLTFTPTLTSTPTSTFTPTATLTPTPVVYGPKAFPTDVDPLTGLKVADPKILDRRPVLVKVSNFPRNGRPQAGLSFADIVFEYYIGEGTNRFAALYYGQDAPKIGPVRSGRLVDWQLTRIYQAILAFDSADQWSVWPALMSQLGKRAISYAPVNVPAMYDIGPHTVTSLFADSAKLTQYAADHLGIPKVRPNLDGTIFNSAAPVSGLLAQKIGVQYNQVDRGEWRYDPASGNYLRWIESVDTNNTVTMVPLIDQLTGKQLSFTNVVILFAYYTEYAPTLHDITVYFNQKGQRAVLFRDGKAIEGIWKTKASDNLLQFYTDNGVDPLSFKPGNTWMVITGINSKLDQPVLGQWEMQFALP
ncbi:MAG: DUF3048 domain-containing protein [Anaerolineaceae bacterium]|jgi:hypothetical protein